MRALHVVADPDSYDNRHGVGRQRRGDSNANLTGFRVVSVSGAGGAVLSDGTGKVTLKLDKNAQSISFTLSLFRPKRAGRAGPYRILAKSMRLAASIAFLCIERRQRPDPGTPSVPGGDWRHRVLA